MILCLETATMICSVALCDRDGVVALKESGEGRSHATQLTVFAGEVIAEAGIKAADLEAVAVSKGPGSYTGLRIGVSTAKGLAYAASIPLISVGTTLSMYLGFASLFRDRYGFSRTDLFCPAIDARRMEIYYSVFNSSGKSVRGIRAEVVDMNFLSGFSNNERIFIFGDGASKCKDVVKRGNVIVEESFSLSASYMRTAAYEALDGKHFEDIAYFEPFYLKDFLTSRPVKNVLGK